MSYVNVIHEVKRCEVENEWVLCFQYCEYFYDDNTSETGYRFIWRKPNGAFLQEDKLEFLKCQIYFI